jgi:type VI secretion system secreted protein VgrG
VGENFVNINSGGIFIKGSMVMINSGGAAGSGSDATPEEPHAPKQPDEAWGR